MTASGISFCVEKVNELNYYVSEIQKEDDFYYLCFSTAHLVNKLRYPCVNMTKVLSEEKRPSPKQFNDSQNYHENDYKDEDMQIEKVQINFFNDILEVIL